MSRYTLKDFQTEYPDDEACLDRIMAEQYGSMAFSCPACGADSKFHRITKRRAYACQHCGHHIYPCVGTIFEKSRTNLTKWFYAMYLFTSTRHGVPAKELERQLGVTYKCAWRMAHELRKLMATADDNNRPLSGHVEVDETQIGGFQRQADRREVGSNKMIVLGMVERDGIVRAGPVDNVRRATLEPLVAGHIEATAIVSTDKLRSYDDLPRIFSEHGAVDHSAKEFRRGDHHTNTIEGHWSQLQRSIRGTHVHISAKHLWKYVSEFSYRRNMRHSHWLMFDHLLVSISKPCVEGP